MGANAVVDNNTTTADTGTHRFTDRKTRLLRCKPRKTNLVSLLWTIQEQALGLARLLVVGLVDLEEEVVNEEDRAREVEAEERSRELVEEINIKVDTIIEEEEAEEETDDLVTMTSLREVEILRSLLNRTGTCWKRLILRGRPS
jgi:hypothetical protein